MRVAVTGATGTIGSAVVHLACSRGHRVLAVARSEDRLVALRDATGAEVKIGDITDGPRMCAVLAGCDRVIHCAALKRVEIYDADPWPATRTNVLGTQRVLDAAGERVTLASTDKAVEPIGVYGATKLIAERMALAAGGRAVRMENVLGSSGSVTQIWRAQVARSEPLTITSPEHSRWWTTADAAAAALLDAGPGITIGTGRAIAATVATLAEALYPGWPVVIVGERPGERRDERMEVGGPSSRDACVDVARLREWLAGEGVL